MYAVVYTIGETVVCVDMFNTYKDACDFTLAHVRMWRDMGRDARYRETGDSCCGRVLGETKEAWTVIEVGEVM